MLGSKAMPVSLDITVPVSFDIISEQTEPDSLTEVGHLYHSMCCLST